MPSVNGHDSHTPVIPNKKDTKKAIGMIMIRPLDNETICAGSTFSVDVKYVDITILKPAKGVINCKRLLNQNKYKRTTA